jgi:hypothetical protein
VDDGAIVGEGEIASGSMGGGTLVGWRLAGADVATVVRTGEVAGAAHAANSRLAHNTLITVNFMMCSYPSQAEGDSISKT